MKLSDLFSRPLNPLTQNKLKAIRFQSPQWTPCRVSLLPATWMQHRHALEEIVLAHPLIFPGYEKGQRDFDAFENPLYEPGRRTDCWGTTWENIQSGMDSHPVEFPLQNWNALDHYSAPRPGEDDLFGPYDWEKIRRQVQQAKEKGEFAVGIFPHGFMYMRLFYLRGFENLMIDLALQEPRLGRLIEIVETYNIAATRRFLELGADLMVFADDLGLQRSLPMLPEMWRRVLKPSFQRLFSLCREAGALVFLHTDGHILEIIPDLIDAGVDLLNPQYRSNGLAGLVETARGKVAIELDLDRQLFPFATPSQIEDHILEAHQALYLPEGGLLLSAECAPDVPLENIDAICTTMEKVCGLTGLRLLDSRIRGDSSKIHS